MDLPNVPTVINNETMHFRQFSSSIIWPAADVANAKLIIESLGGQLPKIVHRPRRLLSLKKLAACAVFKMHLTAEQLDALPHECRAKVLKYSVQSMLPYDVWTERFVVAGCVFIGWACVDPWIAEIGFSAHISFVDHIHDTMWDVSYELMHRVNRLSTKDIPRPSRFSTKIMRWCPYVDSHY